MSTIQNKQKIINISKNLKLSHIGSNLSCLPVLEEIYATKKPDDIVILDNAHAHLAHMVAREQGEYAMSVKNIQKSIQFYGIHCEKKAGCHASGGSLGHGLGIAIGYALVDKKRDIFVILSEGSMMEGSVWEGLRIASTLRLKNLHIFTNFNGYSAVDKIDRGLLMQRMKAFDCQFYFRLTENTEGFDGLDGHYKTI